MARAQRGAGLRFPPYPPGPAAAAAPPRRTGRRVARVLLVLLAAVLCAAAGAVLATMSLPTRTQVGGARASVTLNLSNHITVDPGSRTLLSYRRPSPLRWVGIHAVVESFGVGFTPQHGLTLDPELAAHYAQFFGNPRQDQANIRAGILHRAEAGAATGALLVIALAVGLPRAHRRRVARHPEVQHALEVLRHRYGRPVAVVAALAVAGLAAAIAPGVVRGETVRITPDPVLADSPFAGGQVDGALAGPVELAAQAVTGRITESNHYYNRLRTQVAAALAADQAALATPRGDRDVLVVSDLHCNYGMYRVIGEVARQLRLRLVLDAGDNAFSGSFAFEASCNTLLAQALPRGTDIVLAPGNHDSPLTDRAAAKAGFTVLAGAPVTVSGLRILGAPDPRTSRYGQGLQPADGRAQQTLLGVQAYQLATAACQARAAGSPVDVSLVHDPQVAASIAGSGCGVGLSVAGHTHRLRPLAPLDAKDPAAQVLTEGSSGGAGIAQEGQLTVVGPLLDVATMSVLRYDRDNHLIGSYDLQVHPDATVDIGALRPAGAGVLGKLDRLSGGAPPG